mgnify:CR=1 FL=1
MKANYKKMHLNEMWIPQEVNLKGVDVSYSAYTLLVAIYNYSTNDVCQGRAEFYLSDASIEDKKRMRRGEGGFMSAILNGNFQLALQRADGSNRKALGQAIINNEIELS